MIPIAFIDTETTHLNAEIGDAWEVAVILREDGDATTDTEYVWQIAPNLDNADPESLKIGRYYERFNVPPHFEAAFTGYETGQPVPMTRMQAVSAVLSVLRGAMVVGSNPAFDDRFLRKLLGPGSAQWHYRTVDIATLAVGYLHGAFDTKAGGDRSLFAENYPALPYRSYDLSRAVGVEPPAKDVAHTALGDARWARDVYDAITA